MRKFFKFLLVKIILIFTGLNILNAQCPAVPSPYTENFSGGALPSCWQQSATSGDGWKFTGTPGYAAANNGRPAGSFAWVDFSGTDAGTVMEVVPVDVSSNTNPQIEFDFFCFNTTQPNPTNILYVEANDGTGWVSVGTIQNNTFNGWAPYTYTLVGFDVNGIVSVRFRAESGGATNDFYNDILVDNLAIREAPTCPSPLLSSFGVANLTANSADLQWLAGGNETLWGLEWGPTGFSLGNGSYDTTQIFFGYPISGLSPITSYDFYVQAICGAGDTSYWSGPFTFTTPCAALVPSQLEDFSNGFPPNACWDQAGDGDPGTGPSGIGTSSWTQDGFGNVGTTGAVKVNLYTLGKQEWILSPQYDFSNGGPFQIEFDFGVFTWNQSNPGQLGSDDRVEVLISRDGGTTWNGLNNFNNNYITGPNGNHEIIALPNDTGIVQFAFWASEGTVDDPEDNDVMIDNFAVNPIPSCPQPQYISSFDVTSDSASLTWTSIGSDSAWIVYLTPSGTAPDSSHMLIVNNDTVTYSGLSSNTFYDFYVQSICSGGDSSFLSGPYSVLTNCLPISSPYYQNFDNTNAPNIDQCWNVITTGAAWIRTDNSAADPQRTAPNSVEFYNSSVTTGDLILVSPYITDLDNTKRARFFLQNKASTAYTSDLIVGTMSDPTDPTTFTAYETVFNNSFNSNNWVQIIVSFNNYTGTDNYIALKHGLNSTFDYIWLDDFHYEDIPSCVAPTNLAAANITANNADFSWTAGGNETLWNVQWGPTGFTLGTGTIDSTITTSYSLSTLNPSSAYDFYVQAICSVNDSSYWTGPLTVSTLIQGPIGVNCISGGNAGVVYTDDLESSNGWSGTFGTGSTAGVWNVKTGPTGSIGTGPYGAHSGNNYFYFETSGANPSTSSIVSPLIDLSTAADDAELSFWLHAYGAEIGTLNLGIGNSSTGPFSTIFTSIGQIQTGNNDPYQNVGINLSNYLGQQIFLEFEYTSGTSFTGDVAIDLIEINSCLSCASPSSASLSVNGVTSDSVNLSWQGSGNHTSWLVYLVPNNGTIGNTTPFNVTNDSVVLPVNPSTTYNFFVSGICASGDTSILTGPVVFTTPCTFNTAPYFTDFDFGFPLCWTQETVNDDFDWTIDASGTSSLNTGPSDDITGGGNYLYIETSSPRLLGDAAVVYSPNIDLSTLTVGQLRFFHHMYGATTADLTVEISDNGGLTYDTLFNQFGDQGNQWNEETVTLANYSGVVHFKITAIRGSSFTGDIAIDNFEVREAPTCPKPYNLNAINIFSDSADLTWLAGLNETEWQFYLVPSGGTLSNTSATLVNNDTVTVAVSPNTSYSFYVRGICGIGDTSLLTGPYVFSTPCVSFVSFPYSEGFSTWPPNCWDLTGGNQTCIHYNGNAVEASFWSWSSGQFALMTSPIFDVSSMVSPELLFDWSHLFNANYPNDALEVLVSDNGGTTWTQLWSKSGTDLESNDGATTAAPGSFVSSGRLSLSPYGNSIQIRFNFMSGFGPDCFIDNVEIKEAPQNDVGVVVADLPSASTGCEVDSSFVTATIFNFGYLSQTGFNVQYSLNGTPTIETVFDTLQPGDSLLYTFNFPVDLTQDGSYSFDFTTNLPNDDDTSNDAFGSTLTYENYYTPIAPTVTDDTICVDVFNPNGQSATLTASGPMGVDFDWFDGNGNYVGTGDTLTTDTINSTTSYFAAYQELAPGNMGAANNNFGSGGYYNFFTDGLMFDVYTDLTIDSVTIYPSDTGTVGIIIQSVLGSTVYNGSYSISGPINTISGHKIPIGVNVPAGLAYGMYISAISPGTLSLYRNTTNASYPYDYGNVASITQASNGSTDFYFFFYNWDISTISCYSDMQEAVAYVDPCTQINNIKDLRFSISPNPNNGSFDLIVPQAISNATVEILDLSGKVILCEKLNSNKQRINLNLISRGVYIVSLNQNGSIKTEKLIIK
jgi:hypothetical protein